MMKNKKQFETLLYSGVGVAAMFLILVAVYVISGTVKTRFDLTEDNIYTLSPGTLSILRKLDTPVEIRFYCTQNSKEMPVMLKTYASRVEDLLEEYKKVANANIVIRKLNPEPDSDAETSAGLDGIQGQAVTLDDKIYLGLAVSQLDKTVAIPFLSPDREKLLEYDLTRAISQVMTDEKPVVGVMSPLPVFGEFNPMMMRMGQMQRQDPWVFVEELKRDYDVRQIEMTSTEIPPEVKVLVVVHPKGITDQAQYAIDQFVLRGGKLLAFVDPLSIVDSQSNPHMNPMQAASLGGSTLDKLFKAWGVEFDVNKVVADLNFMTQIARSGRGEQAPGVLTLTQEGLNTDDATIADIDNALIPFGGAFSGTPAEGLQKEVLIHTSANSQLIDRFMAEYSGAQTVKDFAPSGKEYALAIRLTGKFKTAFPDGKPKDTTAASGSEEEKKEESAPAESLKESTAESVVLLIGDSDMVYDHFAAQVQDFFGRRIIIPRNGNFFLVQNMVDQLAGDSALINVRSRASMNRPFTVVRKMQTEARQRYQSKIQELEKGLQETQARLNELQQNRQDGQRFILSPEQQAEIEKFRQQEAQVKRELREVRKNLRQDIDSLENRLKWLNIAGMPFVVALTGLSLALVKRKKTAAK